MTVAEPKWLDARLSQPSPSHYRYYNVLFKYCNSVFSGFAEWCPAEGYKRGDWGKTFCDSGNHLEGGEVLYWHLPLPRPKDVGL